MIDPIAKLLGEWSQEINAISAIFRIALSLIFASILGWERSNKRHAAGLRTFIVVCIACTCAVIIDLFLATDGAKFFAISAASIVGIAIITVNSILYSSRNQIKGLTTSVTLWAAGLLGIAIGAGYYTFGLAYFVVLIIGLSLFPRLETYLKNKSNHFEIHLELKNVAALQDFVSNVRNLGLNIDDIELNTAYIKSGLSVYTISISVLDKQLRNKTHQELIEELSKLEYVWHIEEIQ